MVFYGITEKLQWAVEVYPPAESDCGVDGNGIDNLLESLPILLKQLSTRQREHLAIVIDADSTINNFGFEARRNQIKAIIESFGYQVPDQTPKQYQGRNL